MSVSSGVETEKTNYQRIETMILDWKKEEQFLKNAKKMNIKHNNSSIWC